MNKLFRVKVLLLVLSLVSCVDSIKQKSVIRVKEPRRSVFNDKLFKQTQWIEFALKRKGKYCNSSFDCKDTLDYVDLDKMVYPYCVNHCLIWVVNYKTPFRDSTGWEDGIGSTYRNVEHKLSKGLGVDNGEYLYVYDFVNQEWLLITSPLYVGEGVYPIDYINLEYDGGRKLIPDSTQIVKYGWSSAQKDTLRERLKSAREFIKTHNTDFPFEDVIDDTIRFQGDLFY